MLHFTPRAIAFYKKARFTDCGSTVFHLGPDPQTDRVTIAPVAPKSEIATPVTDAQPTALPPHGSPG